MNKMHNLKGEILTIDAKQITNDYEKRITKLEACK